MSTTPTTELKRYDWTQGPRKIGPRDGKFVQLMSHGVRFMAWARKPVAASRSSSTTLSYGGAWPRRSTSTRRRMRTSYVLEGRLGALLGDEVVYADPGEFVFKPRKQWHTFWNAGDTECRILEIISPSGFEHFFDELAELVAQGGSPDQIVELAARFDLYFASKRASRWPRSTACTSRCRRARRRRQFTKRRSTQQRLNS